MADQYRLTPEMLVPRMGEYLIHKGLISAENLQKALDYQQETTAKGNPILLGQALIDLANQYLQHGFAISTNELSDFLPLFLEFLSFIEPAQAREWLARPAHVLTAMEERLRERGSPYAAVFLALSVLPGKKADPDAVAELRARMSAEEARTVDERWEDAPVTFTAPGPAPAPGGIVARIRTVLRHH